MTTELERAVAFEDALLESAAERIERVPLGSAVFTDSLPVVWSLNLLRVEQPGPTAEVAIRNAAPRITDVIEDFFICL